jgi:hypothetical protein
MSTVASPSVSSNPARSVVPGWVRVGLLALGLPNAVAGLWAIVAPRHWFDHFPGWDPRLVAAEPPFNSHLATDAGAGLFASGVVLVAAAWLADRRSVTLALVAFSAFAVPHAAYHSLNPAPGLSTAEDVVNAAVLVFVVAAAVALWAGSWRRRVAAPADGPSSDPSTARASQPDPA